MSLEKDIPWQYGCLDQNLDNKQKLYKDVYESDEWINNIAPKVEKLIDRNTIVVHNLSPTALSILK